MFHVVVFKLIHLSWTKKYGFNYVRRLSVAQLSGMPIYTVVYVADPEPSDATAPNSESDAAPPAPEISLRPAAMFQLVEEPDSNRTAITPSAPSPSPAPCGPPVLPDYVSAEALEDAIPCTAECNDLCSVCLTPFALDSVLRKLPGCAHRFHLACVDQWLQLRGTCPYCRKDCREKLLEAPEVAIGG